MTRFDDVIVGADVDKKLHRHKHHSRDRVKLGSAAIIFFFFALSNKGNRRVSKSKSKTMFSILWSKTTRGAPGYFDLRHEHSKVWDSPNVHSACFAYDLRFRFITYSDTSLDILQGLVVFLFLKYICQQNWAKCAQKDPKWPFCLILHLIIQN